MDLVGVKVPLLKEDNKMKISKQKFIKKHLFKGIFLDFSATMLTGLIAALTMDDTAIKIHFFFLFIFPFLSALHIIPAYLWNDKKMIERNNKSVFSMLVLCAIWMIPFLLLCFFEKQ